MRYDEKRPKWLEFVETAPEDEDWFRLMVENPCNGQISTISTNIINMDPPVREERPAAPTPPPLP
ncbi:MAG: hypothetical protein IPK53_20415 [bacterium]|nr:hypothetical protein [bacterium]